MSNNLKWTLINVHKHKGRVDERLSVEFPSDILVSAPTLSSVSTSVWALMMNTSLMYFETVTNRTLIIWSETRALNKPAAVWPSCLTDICVKAMRSWGQLRKTDTWRVQADEGEEQPCYLAVILRGRTKGEKKGSARTRNTTELVE